MKRSSTGGTLLDKTNASGFTNYRLYLDGSNRVVFAYDTPYSASAAATDVTQGQAAFDLGTYADNTNYSADKTQIVLQRHTGTAWEELETKIAKETTANVYYSATTPGFSVFAIAVKEKAAAGPGEEPSEQPGEQQPGEQQEEQPGEEPEEQPPAEQPQKSIFQSALFTIAAATVLATTGIGYIYRNRLAIGARIDGLLDILRRRREQRERRK